MKTIKVYILKLTSGNYYVGTTTSVERRWSQHISGTGAAECKRDKPIEKVFEFDTGYTTDKLAFYIEDLTTLMIMIRYGSYKVTGGRYLTTDYKRAPSSWITEEINRIKAAHEHTQPISEYINDMLNKAITVLYNKEKIGLVSGIPDTRFY